MTIAALIAKVRSVAAYDLDLRPSVLVDGTVVDATDSDLVDLLNEAQDRLGAMCPIFDPAIPFSLTAGTGNYDLSVSAGRRVKKALDVVIGGNMLFTCRGTKPGPWSLTELEDRFPTWRTDATGQPYRWVHLSESSVLLHPAPDAPTVARGGHFVSGYAFPAALSYASLQGTSQLPLELHEHLYRMAAALSARDVATNGDQLAKVNAFMQDALQAADKNGSGDRRAKSPIGTTSGRSRPDYLRTR